jgi:hypothetical protein
VLVGAYANAGRGAAYFFEGNGSAWNFESKVVASDGAANDYFGYSVAMSGARALVGAYEKSGPSGPGAAYLFQAGSTTWLERQKIVAPSAGQSFGYSVALTPTDAIVGAFQASNDAGAAYLFGLAPSAPAFSDGEHIWVLAVVLAAFGVVLIRLRRCEEP